ncbi:MAG TPA: hypothetical protein VI756_02685 [Blastocatellia bacterium]
MKPQLIKNLSNGRYEIRQPVRQKPKPKTREQREARHSAVMAEFEAHLNRPADASYFEGCNTNSGAVDYLEYHYGTEPAIAYETARNDGQSIPAALEAVCAEVNK